MSSVKCSFICVSIICSVAGVFAQQSERDSLQSSIDFVGVADVFYSYDFNQPSNSVRQDFFFNYNRHNEVNLNMGLMGLRINDDKFRANLDLHAGTYAQDNYAAEQSVLRHIFQANVGMLLSEKQNLWFDAGIFPSHLGFESALFFKNATLSRSLVAESSPFFLSGAKLSYKPSKKWDLLVVVSNGWQRIQRIPGSSMLSYGTQIIYQANKESLLNWSTFITTDDPDSTRRMRYFSNLYADLTLGENWKCILGFDYGLQQVNIGSSNFHSWWAPTAILTYAFHDEWSATLRGEYYQDENEVIISSAQNQGFDALGYSLNIDYAPHNRPMCRLEFRRLHSQFSPFINQGGLSNSNWFITASMAIKINSKLQ